MKRILSFVFCVLLMSVIFAEASISDKNDKLIQAAEKGNLLDVQAVLADGADVNARTAKSMTPLMMASRKGHTEIVKLLLDRGADVNVKSIDGYTALKIAKKNGRTEIVEILKKSGAKE